MRVSVGYLVVAFGTVLSVSAWASPECPDHILYLPGSPCAAAPNYEREPSPEAAPRIEVQKTALVELPSDDVLNRQLDAELINLSIDRELATSPSPVEQASQAPVVTPASFTPSPTTPIQTAVLTETGWSSESPALRLSSANLFYKTTDVSQSHAAQTIRFRVQNPNIERASVTFDVDLLSERGRHFRRLVGAIVESGADLSGQELELSPFDAGDHIVFVRILGSMVCAEPQVAAASTGRYHDACLPVHSGLTASR